MIKIEWLDLLSKGLITSSLVFAATVLWEFYKTRRELKGRALLLFAEVNDQCYRLSTQSSVSIECLLTIPDSEWNSSRYFLAQHLSFKKFQVIHEHYRAMRSARKILEIEGSLPEPFYSEHIAKANAAMFVLLDLAKLDKQKLKAYNKKTTE